jgi:predicted dehydrogenase
MNKTRYAIIGSGSMGMEHIRNIELIDNAQVIALCDSHQPSINSSLEIINNKVEVFENHKELIDADIVDAYIIATPNFTHIEVLRDLVQTKAHLLIEKPLCTTVEDCLEFKKLANGYPGVIWTAMEYRYMPPVARFIEEVHKGTIGDLKMLSIREHRFPFLVKVNDWNRFEKNSGGTLVEKCCHFFDLMRLITKSEVLSVFASGGQDNNHLDESYDGKTPDILDNAFIIMNFENGVRGLLDLCMFAENSKVQEEICGVGHKGKIETGVPSNASGKHSSELLIGLRGSNKILSEIVEVDKNILEAGSHHGSTFYEHIAFINAINNQLDAEVTLDDGLKAVAIGQAAELSIKENRVVMMSELLN